MQTPSLARMVLAIVNPSGNNGSDVCPAVITRVWGAHPSGGWTVNLRTVKDGSGTDEWLTSRLLFDTEELARDLGGHGACFWPPRV